jgi:hypothetical protein
MADAPKDEEVITEAPEEQVTPSVAAPSQPTEEEQIEAPAPTGQEAEEEEEQPMSRRERLRVQDLLGKYPDLQERTKVQAPNFRDKVQGDEDTYKILEQTTQDFGQNLMDEATKRVEFTNWKRFLTIDDNQVRGKYPELDKNNEKFYPALADALNVKYLRTVGYNPGNPEKGISASVQNPDISYQDFVESEMEFANELASMKVSDTQKNIARQAAHTGIRPGGTSSKRLDLNKAPQNMTDEELKAAIAQGGL